MGSLPRPIKDMLRPTEPDEASLRRIWAGVQRRTERRRGRAVRAIFPALAVAGAVAALVLWLRPAARPEGPLLLGDGSPVETLAAPVGKASEVDLSDGSRIRLEGGARIEALENGPRRFSCALRRGRATFAVRPGGPRRWEISSELATVEVVGTRFTLDKTDRALSIAVEEGTVIVRGPAVEGGARRLEAGGALLVTMAAPDLGSAPAPAPAPVTGEPEVTAPPRPRPTAGWRRLAADRRFPEAYAALGPKGVAAEARRAPGPDELFDLVDVARLSGHPAEALPILTRIVDEFPADPRAGLAAFTRGRVEADDLGQPRAAAASFRRAVELGLPAALAEDASARVVESLHRAGAATEAEEALRDHERRFPAGQQVERLRRLVGR